MTRILVVTGTDTGVGKTHVVSMIARQVRCDGTSVGIYKPACSGAETLADGSLVWDDVERLHAALDSGFERDRICPQRFRAPLAPPVAARREGQAVDPRLIREGLRWWLGRVDLLLVEGAGGLLSPIAERSAAGNCAKSAGGDEFETIADLAAEFSAPLLVVARLGLGTINHTLLTVEGAQRRGVVVSGVILNQETPGPIGLAESTNPRELAARCDAPILGIVRHGADKLTTVADWPEESAATSESGTLRSAGGAIRMDWLSLASETGSPRPVSAP